MNCAHMTQTSERWSDKKRQYALGRKDRVLEKRNMETVFVPKYALLKALKIPAQWFR